MAKRKVDRFAEEKSTAHTLLTQRERREKRLREIMGGDAPKKKKKKK